MASVIKAALPLLGLLGAAVLVTGGVVLLARAGGSPAETSQAGLAGEAPPASQAAAAETTARSVPAIDAAAPAEVETATFALG